MGTCSVGVVLRLRHLHNALSEEWTERTAADGSDSGTCDKKQAISIRMDSTSAVYFHRRLHRLFAHWPPDRPSDMARSTSPVQRSRRRESKSLDGVRASSVTPSSG